MNAPQWRIVVRRSGVFFSPQTILVTLDRPAFVTAALCASTKRETRETLLRARFRSDNRDDDGEVVPLTLQFAGTNTDGG